VDTTLFKLFLLLLLLSVLPGCRRNSVEVITCPGQSLSVRELDVKPLYRTAFGCGPASVAMVLQYHGFNVSKEEATAALYSKTLEGTLITDMRVFASRYVKPSRVTSSSMCEIVDSLSRGNPVILFLDLGEGMISNPHYIVAVGYDMRQQLLVYHNGYSKFTRAPFNVLKEPWRKTGNLALFIEGK